MKANLNFAIAIFLLLGFSTFISLKGIAATKVSAVRVPVLNECVNDAKHRILNTPEQLALETEYIEFDRRLYTHPTLAGYIEVKSSNYDKDFLSKIANGYITNCDIDTTMKFDKGSPKEAEKLFNYIKAAENQGADAIYIVNENDTLRILFRTK